MKRKHVCTLPDGGSLDLTIEEHQIYVFVDDDKGAKSGADKNVTGMFARAFDNVDCDYFVRLVRALVRRSAWDWHAADMKGFPQDPEFRSILKTINRCKTRAFAFRRIEHQLDNDDLMALIKQSIAFEALRDWQRFWPLEDSRQARLLMWTVQSTVQAISRSHLPIPRPSGITFFTDWMNFVDISEARKMETTNAPGCFLALDVTTRLGIDLRVVSVFDKARAPSWILALLGLVDGECWLFSRFLRTQPTGGRSIEEQGIEFSAVEDKKGYRLDVESTFKAIDALHLKGGGHAKLAKRLPRYLASWRRWLALDRWADNGRYLSEHLDRYPKPPTLPWARPQTK